MRKLASVVIAAVFVLSGVSVPGVASAQTARNCDQCLVGVAPDGTILGSRGVVSTRRVAAGIYDVDFKRTIAGCAIAATQVVFDNSTTPLAYVSVSLLDDRPKSLRYFVLRHNPTGSAFVDSAFTSTLTCIAPPR